MVMLLASRYPAVRLASTDPDTDRRQLLVCVETGGVTGVTTTTAKIRVPDCYKQ